MPNFVYQLRLRGHSACFSGPYEKRSTTVFLSEEAALRRTQQMIDKCCDKDLVLDYCVRNDAIRVDAVKLEVLND